MYADGTLRDYLEAASSGRPTPGGGSVAACTGALGMSMACMAANFTVGKKKYAPVEAEVKELLSVCRGARDELLSLVDEDVAAYGAVSKAYGMPKGTDEEQGARRAAIQEALVVAMAPPLKVVRATRAALAALVRLAEIGNPNLISDVGVAALMAEAALRAGKLNVEINLKSLKDEALVERTRGEIAEAAAEAAENAAAVMERTTRTVGGTS
jgi:formiminotetrahydrofolate cyclodeaminase